MLPFGIMEKELPEWVQFLNWITPDWFDQAIEATGLNPGVIGFVLAIIVLGWLNSRHQ